MPAIKIAAAVLFGLLAMQMLAGTISTLLAHRKAHTLYPTEYLELGRRSLRSSFLLQGVATTFFAIGCVLVLSAWWPLGLLIGAIPIGVFFAAMRYKMLTVLHKRIER